MRAELESKKTLHSCGSRRHLETGGQLQHLLGRGMWKEKGPWEEKSIPREVGVRGVGSYDLQGAGTGVWRGVSGSQESGGFSEVAGSQSGEC